MSWISNKVQAFKDHSKAADKLMTADGFLNNAELGGNEEAVARAKQDQTEAIAAMNDARKRLWGNLYRGD